MSKYIIELGDSAKKVVAIYLDEGAVWTGVQVVEDLEVLNSDYINEHFGDLQDTAYQRGLEEGKAQAERGCKGCEYEGKTGEHLPCEYCKNNFRSQWTTKDDEIEVGDEVEISQSDENDVWVVTKVEKHDDYEAYCAINKDGDNIYFEEEQDRVTKTGRHFDIASILEEMKA